MAYPDKDTAEFWDLVAQGYRVLIERPPKFLAPGSTIEGFRKKAEEAEAKASKLRAPVEFSQPTEDFEDSLIRRESEMFREKVKAVAAENREAIERGSFLLNSLEKDEMMTKETVDAASKAIHASRGYGLKTLEFRQTLADIGEPVKVTEDLWKSVLRLN